MPTIKTELGDIEVSEEDAQVVDFKGYLGNRNLKRAGVKVQWTKYSLQEYAKCAADPLYFIENYMKVVHVDHGLVPFILRDYQKELLHNVHTHRRNIITMARQSGKSVTVVGYLLWYILFNEYKTVMLLANKAATAREILGKAQIAYMALPHWLQMGVEEWNKGSIILENGSRAIAEATSSNAIRGFVSNMLIIDEAAFVEHWEEFSASVIPTITSGETTKLVLISTPKGLNSFYKTWEMAQHYGKDPTTLPPGIQWNGYVPLHVTWHKVPGRGEKWYKETLAELNFDMDKFNAEYECEFLGSSGTLIAGWKLKELVPKVPIYEKENLRKYKDPIKTNTYVMTVDVSEGKGMDYSAFQVTDITKMPFEQVCTFRSNLITPTEFAQIIHGTALAYNSAAVLIEYASLGPEVSDTLFNDLQYDNLLHTESAGSRGKRISDMQGKMIDRGIKMSTIVKSTGCSLLKLLIEQNQLIINDYNTIQELSTFSRKAKSFCAEEGCHDDLVMSYVVFAWLSNQVYFKNLTDINTLAELRDHTQQYIEDNLTPFGFAPSLEEEMVQPAKADPWSMSWHDENEREWPLEPIITHLNF
jgi:hypothetical protein